MFRVHWRVLGGIALVFGFLQIILVSRASESLDLQQLKESLQAGLNGQVSTVSSSVALFGVLIVSFSGGDGADSGSYQSIVIILVSLALIWALRQLHAGTKIKIRDAFYRGMYPLVPFILVLLVIGLELLPAALGSFIYTTVVTNGIAITFLEQVVWMILFGLLSLLSLYMVCSSIFALYIVTLPETTPMQALRSARQLVFNRRWQVMRKILFLPLILVLLCAVTVVPLIIFAAGLAELVFFIYVMFSVVIAHDYMYRLYRELL